MPKGTELENRVKTLYHELERQNIRFRPVCYLADEWFSPEDDPIIGMPFYLAHPRLIKLEEAMMLEAEGASLEACMRLLRHEAGHALDHAYRLSHRKGVQKIFGKPSKSYNPDTYRPHPYSKSFVINLEKIRFRSGSKKSG